jgi:hypothetical protein
MQSTWEKECEAQSLSVSEWGHPPDLVIAAMQKSKLLFRFLAIFSGSSFL